MQLLSFLLQRTLLIPGKVCYDEYNKEKAAYGKTKKDRNMIDLSIRKAEIQDIPGILHLLSQVLEVHAKIRPDIFVSGTTKYTADELAEMLRDERRPVWVAADENNRVLGYAFCQIQEPPFTNTMIPFTTLFIDDFCVEEEARGQHIGKQLFEHVRNEAKQLGCYEVTLNVWEGNDNALRFYQAMGFRPKETQMEYII
jgi:ribosomal protein S18 acetylase RimI-like enzyme